MLTLETCALSARQILGSGNAVLVGFSASWWQEMSLHEQMIAPVISDAYLSVPDFTLWYVLSAAGGCQ